MNKLKFHKMRSRFIYREHFAQILDKTMYNWMTNRKSLVMQNEIDSSF